MNTQAIILSLCFLASQALAVDPELDRLQKSYEEASKRALAPVQATYQKELQRLMDQHTKAGRLDAALEVKAELEKFGPLPPPVGSPPPSSAETALRQRLTKGKFVFYFAPPRSKLMTFLRDGTLGEGGSPQEFKWKIEGNEVLIYSKTGQLTHAVTYHADTDSFKPSERATLYMSRKSYMEDAKK